jgi:uncharacterized protein with von Willebrand factor type A (vWA) domain
VKPDSSYTLPLQRLFLRLRGERFRLGVDQYHWVLEALQGGHGVEDLDALRRLCKTVWLKRLEDEIEFDYLFDQEMKAFGEEQREIQAKEKEAEREEGEKEKQEAPQAGKEGDESKEEIEKREKEIESQQLRQERVQVETARKPALEGTESVSNAQESTKLSQQGQGRRFILEPNFLPVSPRQMRQNWRYLREWRRDGPKTELDLPGTLKKVAKYGFFTEPVLQAPRQNMVEVRLLIDWGGSMVPFHGLARELMASALQQGNLPRAGAWFFHDIPRDRLYLDPFKTQGVELSAWLQDCNPQRTRVLIFSDAGAARDSFEKARLRRTEAFKEVLSQHVLRTAWLNPMPAQRWLGNSAEDIAELMPMFEANRFGLEYAINYLRGRGGGE